MADEGDADFNDQVTKEMAEHNYHYYMQNQHSALQSNAFLKSFVSPTQKLSAI